MPPILYLVRHADALDHPVDHLRKLSSRGYGQIAHLAKLLRGSGAFAPTEVWYSPLVRAKETAELLAHELKLRPGWNERRELEPEADPALAARAVAHARHALALCGHNPHLSLLASRLVAGAETPVVFTFQKATVLALEPAGSRWSVRWQISPDLFG